MMETPKSEPVIYIPCMVSEEKWIFLKGKLLA